MNADLAKGIRWNLSDLYESVADPRLGKDLDLAEAKAKAFEKKYKAPLQKLAAGGAAALDLAALISDYKKIVTLLTRPLVYAHLRFSENTADASRGALMQKLRTRATDIQNHTLFWEVYWTKLTPGAVARLMKNPKTHPERHYLQTLRRWAPHTLAEGEEKIMSAKSNTSGSAFARLFDETMNSIPFYVEENKKRIVKTEGEVLAMLHSPERNVRKEASESLATALSENSRLIVYIYNMILDDHRISMKLRKYSHPSESRNLSNETDIATVKGLISSVKKAYPLVARYYALKTRLLGLKEMYDYDRYAPLEATQDHVPFSECRKIVVSGYQNFSPEAGKLAAMFFDNKWIDAEVRPGKQSGGFCADTVPDLHPYILVNYTGSLRDVLTVAHEVGHGIHQYLSRGAGILESGAPLTMAETASVFGEMLIFEKLASQEKNPRKRLALLCGQIDDQFATVFRQIALTDFEWAAHEAGLKNGELSDQILSEIWVDVNARLYGKSVILTDNYRHGWKYIPHFVHTPFYCYAYAFAQLFVLSLYEKYKADPKDFVPKYFQMLSFGGSRRPEEIAATCGVDLKDPKFWNRGLKLLERLVTEAETLAAKVDAAPHHPPSS